MVLSGGLKYFNDAVTINWIDKAEMINRDLRVKCEVLIDPNHVGARVNIADKMNEIISRIRYMNNNPSFNCVIRLPYTTFLLLYHQEYFCPTEEEEIVIKGMLSYLMSICLTGLYGSEFIGIQDKK